VNESFNATQPKGQTMTTGPTEKDFKKYRELRDAIVWAVTTDDSYRNTIRVIERAREWSLMQTTNDPDDDFWLEKYGEFTVLEQLFRAAFDRGMVVGADD